MGQEGDCLTEARKPKPKPFSDPQFFAVTDSEIAYKPLKTLDLMGAAALRFGHSRFCVVWP
jgi:hypothetical protein